MRIFFFCASLCALGCAVQAQPKLIAPADFDNTVVADTARLVWHSLSADDLDYNVHLSCEVNRQEVDLLRRTMDTTAVLTDLTPGATYFWQVSALDSGTLRHSEIRSFTTALTLPQVPTLLWPENKGLVVSGGDVVLGWEPSQASGSEFRLQVSEDSTFSSPEPMTVDVNFSAEIFDERNTPPCYEPRAYFHIYHTQLEKTYYWRLKERNHIGASPWSEVQRFTIVFPVATEQEEGVPATYRLAPVYPNPFASQATVAFSLPRTERVRLRIFDVTGRLVATPLAGTYPAGTTRFQWQAGHLPSGVYVAQLQAGAHLATRPLVIRR